MLSFAEEICLLALDEKTGKVYKNSNEILLGYSLISAIFIELSFMKKIDIDLEHLIVIDKTPTGNKILDSILSNLPDPEIKKPVSFWVKILLNKAGKTLELVRSELIDKGVLERIYEKKVWGIYRKIYRIINNKEVNELITSIRKLVLNDEETPDDREAALIGLITACNLFDTILSPRELQVSEERIQTLSKLDMIGREAGNIMDEIKKLFFASLKNRYILYIKSNIFAILHEHELFITNEDKRHLGIALTLAGFFIYAVCTVSLDIESKDKAIPTGTALYIGLAIFQLFMLIYFLPLCLLLKGKGFFKCSHPWLIIIRSLLSMTSVFFYSLARVRTGNIDNSMLYSTDGLWIVLILLALKVKLNKFAILGAGIGVVGIVFVYFFDINSDLIGGCFGALSGISLAIVLFLTSYMIKRDPPLRIGVYQSLIGLILYAGVSIYLGVKTGWTMPDMSFVITMMLTGYCFGLALFCWIEAFYYAEVYTIGAASLALPVFTETMKWLLIKEFSSLPTIVGSLIITLAGILIIVSSFLKNNERKQI